MDSRQLPAPYDQDWLNYQQEIALRHTSAKKNKTDGVRSTPCVPFEDVIAFVAVMNETIKPFLGAKAFRGRGLEDAPCLDEGFAIATGALGEAIQPKTRRACSGLTLAVL
jgi:hypothetical protein